MLWRVAVKLREVVATSAGANLPHADAVVPV